MVSPRISFCDLVVLLPMALGLLQLATVCNCTSCSIPLLPPNTFVTSNQSEIIGYTGYTKYTYTVSCMIGTFPDLTSSVLITCYTNNENSMWPEKNLPSQGCGLFRARVNDGRTFSDSEGYFWGGSSTSGPPRFVFLMVPIVIIPCLVALCRIMLHVGRRRAGVPRSSLNGMSLEPVGYPHINEQIGRPQHSNYEPVQNCHPSLVVLALSRDQVGNRITSVNTTNQRYGVSDESGVQRLLRSADPDIMDPPPSYDEIDNPTTSTNVNRYDQLAQPAVLETSKSSKSPTN